MSSNQEARQSVMRPGGPRGSMGRPIEKAGDSKAALVRLVRYLAGERRMITGLLLMILVWQKSLQNVWISMLVYSMNHIRP